MELFDFFIQTQAEIRTELAERAVSGEETFTFDELVFSEIVAKHMSEIGMTFDDYQICHYNAKVGSEKVRLSGYAVSEDGEQLDLFVSLYQGSDTLQRVPDAETRKAAKYCSQFLTACIEGKLSEKMDPSHDAYGFVLTIKETYDTLNQIRIYILTDGQVKTHLFKPREIRGKTVKLEVIDIERLFNHWQEGKPRDELVVNFEDLVGSSLPCVWVPNEMDDYDYAMTVIPGEALRYLYDKFGPRILEANVRSFLSQRGKVNKGIRDTLRNEPELFMAYNNGIVLVADEARLAETQNGSVGISWLKGMQIVNGGQTMASMFFTKKKYPGTDLSKVRVPAKVIVLRKADDTQEEALISDISRYANSQNAVRQSDLSANKPFHITIEKLAMTTFCPDGISRWFYERAAGSYQVMLEREGKTPAGINKIKKAIPPARKITKTDLSKYLCAWLQRPDLVSLGGQKNFQAFMNLLSPDNGEERMLPDTNEYKEMIAKTIIFKEAEKIIRPSFQAYRNNITAYTISLLSKHFGEKLNLEIVWNNQTISQELKAVIYNWAHHVYEHLNDTANEKMISEWAKKRECWDLLSKKALRSAKIYFPELKSHL